MPSAWRPTSETASLRWHGSIVSSIRPMRGVVTRTRRPTSEDGRRIRPARSSISRACSEHRPRPYRRRSRCRHRQVHAAAGRDRRQGGGGRAASGNASRVVGGRCGVGVGRGGRRGSRVHPAARCVGRCRVRGHRVSLVRPRGGDARDRAGGARRWRPRPRLERARRAGAVGARDDRDHSLGRLPALWRRLRLAAVHRARRLLRLRRTVAVALRADARSRVVHRPCVVDQLHLDVESRGAGAGARSLRRIGRRASTSRSSCRISAMSSGPPGLRVRSSIVRRSAPRPRARRRRSASDRLVLEAPVRARRALPAACRSARSRCRCR